jgi:LmbE family N-acetylglucosaminyl deacetylase
VLPLAFGPGDAGPRKVLCLGAHCDDIEIGCGGTLLQLRGQRPDLDIRWVMFSGSGERRAEARASAEVFLGSGGGARVDVHDFRDGFLPYQAAEVKDTFESIKREFDPDMIFTHTRQDKHQDHRLVGELTWNTFRNHLIFEYEIPKYDGDLGQPSAYVPLRQADVDTKVTAVWDHYPSQRGREWFDADTLRALMRLRGVECNAPDRYAEAFHCPKWVIAAA